MALTTEQQDAAYRDKKSNFMRWMDQQTQLESDRALYQIEQEREAEDKKNQPQKPEKMGIMFFSILLLLCVVADFVDMLTAGTIGWLVGLFVDGVLLLSAGLSKAGRKQFKRIIIGIIGEKVPILNILPLRSLFLTWSFINSRHELPIQLGLSGYRQTKLGE